MKCNGLDDLCDLRINQVTFPGSHNAGSGFDGVMHFWIGIAASSCFYRNHGKSYAEQFAFGVRYFDIDTCYGANEALNCHCLEDDNFCAYSGSIKKGLLEIDSSLKANRNEIVLLHFNRDSQDGYRVKISKSIESVLLKLWAPNNEKKLAMNTFYGQKNKWPTLREAITSNQRVFVFMDYNLKKHLPNYKWLVSSNSRIASTWGTVTVTSSCSDIKTNAESKCGSNKEFIELSAFGTYGNF